jgi:hypothetical protein
MRLWKKIVLTTLTIVVFTLGCGYVYLFPMHGLEKIVNAKLNSLLAKRTGFQVAIGAIRGDILNRLILDNVVVTYHDSLETFQTLRAGRLTASYSFSNLWHRNLRFSLVQIDSLVLHVKKDTLDRFLPTFATAEDTGSSQPPSFFIGTCLLNDASIDYHTPTDSISSEHLSLEASFLIEEGTYSMDIKRLQMVSNRPRTIVRDAGGKLTFSNGNLYFENLRVWADSTRVNVTGLIDVRRQLGSVELQADSVNLASIQKFGGPELSGVVSLKGTVGRDTSGLKGDLEIVGTFLQAKFNDMNTRFRLKGKRLELDTIWGRWFDSSLVNGRATIDFGAIPESYTVDMDLRKFDLLRLVPTSFSSDLNGHVTIHGRSFQNRDLSLLITTDISESSFDTYPIQEAHGNVHVTTDSIRFVDSFSVRYFENWLTVDGKAEYSGLMDLNVVGDITRLDRYTGQFFIKEPAGRCKLNATLIGRTSDPDVRGVLSSDSIWAYQLYSTGLTADIDIPHFFTLPAGRVQCRFAEGAAWNIPYDSLLLAVSLDSGNVRIDSLFSQNRYSSISGRGNLHYAAYPSPLSIDTLRWTLFGQRFYNRGGMEVDVDSAGYNFRKATITDGRGQLDVLGRVNYDESLAATLTLSSAQVASWVHLFRSDWAVGALASCRVAISGNLDRPEFVGVGSLDSLVYKDLRLGNMTFAAQYADRKMTIDSLVVLSNPGVYHTRGNLSVDLALTQRPIERLPKSPMSLNISMSDTVFNLVYLFLPSVEDLRGKFYANFRLTGTPAEPHLNGEAWIRDGRLKYFDLADTLRADSVAVSMKDNEIVFDRLETYVFDKRNSNKRSYAVLDGALVVKSLDSLYYDVDVSLPKEFPFRYELDDIAGAVEGDMHVEGYNTPEVTGDLRLLKMQYRAEFATAEEGSPLLEALSAEDSWGLNLNVEIPSNYWIKNTDVDAELAGIVNLVREKGNYRFAGEMTFLRGKGFLFDKTFRIDPVSKVTFEDIEYLNPRLDITASTRIPGQRRETDSVREDIDLCVHVSGTLEAPQIDPCAGTQFTQQDILPLIVANYYSSDSATATGQFGRRAIDLLTSRVSQIGARGLGRLGN